MKPAPLSPFMYFARDCARLAHDARLRSTAAGIRVQTAQQRQADNRWEGEGGSQPKPAPG